MHLGAVIGLILTNGKWAEVRCCLWLEAVKSKWTFSTHFLLLVQLESSVSEMECKVEGAWVLELPLVEGLCCQSCCQIWGGGEVQLCWVKLLRFGCSTGALASIGYLLIGAKALSLSALFTTKFLRRPRPQKCRLEHHPSLIVLGIAIPLLSLHPQ